MPDSEALCIVDAANVVGSRPDGWWRDRAAAAERLVSAIRVAMDDGRVQAPVTVVLEGRANAAATPATPDGLEVVRATGSGDDRIAELAYEAAGRCVGTTVVTADRELSRRVRASGARVEGPRDFLARLEMPAGRSLRL